MTAKNRRVVASLRRRVIAMEKYVTAMEEASRQARLIAATLCDSADAKGGWDALAAELANAAKGVKNAMLAMW